MKKAVYIQKRADGLQKIMLYLTGEKVTFNKVYQLDHKPWIYRLEITGTLGEWNLRRVWDIVQESDLNIEYSSHPAEKITVHRSETVRQIQREFERNKPLLQIFT